ncbi:MAG TPA: hypothetical protein VFB96_17930 [Pirellulaceae bacterium]|nr:hypothetical protein [Pirellulaceae bacterium]
MPPPVPLATSEVRENLRRVAKYQQRVLQALVLTLGTNIVVLASARADFWIRMAILAAALAVAIFAMVSIFRLASEFFGQVVGVLCAILVFIPCIALITLYIVDQQATRFLQRHGVKVGLMGADPNQI